MMIRKIMPLVLAVSISEALKRSRPMVRPAMAKMSAPTAPTEAASLGEKMPVYMPPITRANSRPTGQTVRKVRIRRGQAMRARSEERGVGEESVGEGGSRGGQKLEKKKK